MPLISLPSRNETTNWIHITKNYQRKLLSQCEILKLKPMRIGFNFNISHKGIHMYMP